MGLKGNHGAMMRRINDGHERTATARDRDRLPKEVDILLVGSRRDEDGVSIHSRIDGALDGGLVGGHMDRARSLHHGKGDK